MKTYTLHSSDAFGRDFAIVDAEGNKIEGIYEFIVRGEVGAPISAEIYLRPMAANTQVVLREVNFTCPNCGDTVFHECEQQTLGGD